MEVKAYQMEEHIKHVTIGVETYRARRIIPKEYGGAIDLEKETEKRVVYELCAGLEQFVSTKKIDHPEYGEAIEAQIFLPYVYDDAMRNKDSMLKYYSSEIDRLNRELSKIQYIMRIFSELPWYKRIWKAFKKSW